MIFSGIVAAISAVATFIGGLGAIGSFALQMAAGLGISYAAQALAGKKQQSPSSAASSLMGVQGTIQSGGDVPRSYVVGEGATGGSLAYANFWGAVGGTPNAFFTQVIAVSDLPVKGLLGVWVNGQKCTLADIAHAEFGYPVLEYRVSGTDYLWVKFYDGEQVAADPFLVSKVGSADRPYEATRIFTGVAYAIGTALVNDSLFTGFPQFLFEVDGIRLYDPSRDDTAGGEGDQRYSDPSSWGGDGDYLPAVQLYNLMRGISYAGQWLYGLQGMTAARLPAANWIAQIGKCRAEIDLGEGEAEPAYRSGGQIVVNVQLGTTTESLLTTCQGKLSEIGGFYKVHLGAPDSPSFSFTDNDILSTAEQSFTPFFGLADTVTGMAAKYPERTEAWAMKPAPALYRTDLDARAGNRRMMADVELDFVPYETQAQRVMQSALQAAQRARRHTHSFPPSFWFIEPGDVGAWTSARNGYTSKLFEVNGAVDKANLDITVDLTEVDPADFLWDFATDFTPGTSGPTIFPRPAPQPVVDWFAEPFTIRGSDGVNRRPAIRMSWDGAMPGVAGVQYEVRLASDETNVTRGRTDQLAAGAIVVTQALLPDTEYEVRGQYIPSSPRDMLWSDWLSVTTPDVRLSLSEFDDAVREQVTSLIDAKFDENNRKMATLATLVQQALARTALDKRIVKSEIVASSDRASASIEETRTVAVTAQEAVADLSTAVAAQFGDLGVTVTENSSAIATLDGYAAGQWSVAVDVDGNAVGLVLFNDSNNVSHFTVTADTFQVAFPGHAGGTAVPVFTIANVGGVAKLALRGDMIVDGSIITQMIAAGAITSVTITAGAVNTTQLAINSVDINTLIAGAATNVKYFTHAANPSAAGMFWSDTVDVQSGQAQFEYFSQINTDNTVPFTYSISFYVDGVLKKTRDWASNSAYAGGGFTHKITGPVAIKTNVTGLSPGVHTFELRQTTIFNPGTGLAAGDISIYDFRR